MDHSYAIENHTAERYLLQELNEEERDAYEEHFFSCSTCAEEVKIATEFMENARQLVQDEIKAQLYGQSDHRSIWGSWLNWRSMLHPMPAMACLLLVFASGFGVYQNRVTIPDLKHTASAQLITSDQPHITLNQAHGGPDGIVTLSQGQPLIVRFAIPSEVFSAWNLSSYQADVENEAGITEFSFVLSGKQTEDTIVIRFAPGALAPGKYSMVIREVNSTRTESGVKGELERLPFEIVLQK